MKKILIIAPIIIIITIVLALLLYKKPVITNQTLSANTNVAANQQTIVNINSNTNTATDTTINGFVPPLDRATERVTKKPFGIYITPAVSPVQPEKFFGYHTGTDFEIFPEELSADVSVHAICSGNLKFKGKASGYGSVAVQNCQLNNELVTVIYGHLKLASVSADTGDNLNADDIIGILGADKSAETDGERKHLHLGIHKGTVTDILGYVSSQNKLTEWIDPCLYVCHN